MTYHPKMQPGRRYPVWYRRACAEHDRAMAAPMPPETRYMGERFERRFFEERYRDMMGRRRKSGNVR